MFAITLQIIQTTTRESEWQWHQLGHTQVCTSLQTDNHATTQFFIGRMLFLMPNQQHQSTEGKRQQIFLNWLLSPNMRDSLSANHS